jgi:hypothetical protein
MKKNIEKEKRIMPNWVYNYVNVYGKEKDLKKFKEDVALNDEIVFSFNKFIAMPEDTSSWATEDNPGWYNWAVKNWGTIWDCEDSVLNEEKDLLEYEFATAWNGPHEIYDKMIKTYKKLNFEIGLWESINFWGEQLAASGGKYTQPTFHKPGVVQLKKNLYMDLGLRSMFEL